MAFIKLDCGILDSSVWVDSNQLKVFLAALLIAEPIELQNPMPQFFVKELKHTGFVVPPGWYGFVAYAGIRLVQRAMIAAEEGLTALEQLGEPDQGSRSDEFSGRRLVRISGGFVVLNYDKYRSKDHNSTERVRLYRLRKKSSFPGESDDVKRVTSVTCNAMKPSETYAYAYADVYEDLKSKAKATSAFSIPDWIPQEAWDHYEEMRKKIRKPMTDTARKWAVSHLDRLRKEGHNPEEVLEQSVFNSWQGLFEPKSGTAKSRKSKSERVNDENQRTLERVLRKNSDVDSLPESSRSEQSLF